VLQGQRIVCLSSLPWQGLQTSRHHLARILGVGNEVLFVDPPGNMLRGARSDHGRLHPEGGGVTRMATPPHLPYGGTVPFRLSTPINQRRYAGAVARAVARLGWRRPILWNSCVVYLGPRVADRLDPAVHVLHMTDSVWDYPWYGPEYEPFLTEILRSAHVVCASTPAMTDRLQGYGVRAHHLPHGVDVELFGPVARGEVVAATPMIGRQRPRIGFAGNLEDRLDMDVVRAVACGPGSVTLVGPSSLDRSDLSLMEDWGCFLEGPVAYEDVPSWFAGFDIAILPYRTTRLVSSSRPLKLLEYLAAGLPVVSTDIPAARELTPHVFPAADPGDFARTVARLWADRERVVDDPGARLQRSGLARPHSWTSVAEQLSGLIDGATS
jgi:teichuronic acid biosynthesis glycosyltransferase TuaH